MKLLRLGFTLLGCLFATRPAAAQDTLRTYQVEVFLDRRYTDTDSSVATLAETSRRLPPTRFIVNARHGSISGLVADVYGLGASQLPRTYALLEAEIRRLNGLADSSVLPQGPILVPSIPRWSPPVGYDRRNPTWGYNHTLRSNRRLLASDGFLLNVRGSLATRPSQDVVGGGSIALAPEWLHPQEEQKGAFLASVRFETTDTSVVQEQLATGQALLLDGPFEIMESEVSEAAVDVSDGSFTISDTELRAVVDVLARRKIQVPLVILDVEWPNRAAALQATQWLYPLINTVRCQGGLQALPVRPITPGYSGSSEPHSAAIANALSAFSGLDGQEAVAVRYLPLAPLRGADSVLVDLVATYYAVRRVEMRPGSVPNDSLARSDAIRVIGSIPPTFTRDVTPVLRGSRVILDALLFVLDRNSRQTGVPYVLNTSWVLKEPLSVLPQVYEPPRGLIVAATGNFDEDVVVARRDLTRWSLNSRYVLSVENYNAQMRRTCQSSRVPAGSEAVELSRVVAFPGARTNTGRYRCGTSFSAPRVGWAIAAKLAAQGHISAWDLWMDSLWREIRQASVAFPQGDPTHPFNLERFLQPPTQ